MEKHAALIATAQGAVEEHEAALAALADAREALADAEAERDAAEAAFAAHMETAHPEEPEPDPGPEPEPVPTAYGPVPRKPPTTPYVTPDQFGAKGDGKANDAAAVAKALNAAVGKTLWLPEDRVYRCDSLVSIPSKVTIIGAGVTSVLKFTWRGVAGGGSNVRSAGTKSTDIHLSNFVIEGGGTGLPGGLKASNPEGLVPLLKLIRLDRFSVRNMELRNAEGLTITYTGCSQGVIERNWVHHSGRDGITAYRNRSANVTDMLIQDNLIEKVGDDAIAINGLVPGHNLAPLADGSSPLPKRITIARNVIRGWGKKPVGGDELLGRGIALNGVAGVVCEDNEMYQPNGTGILLTGCNSHICSGSDRDWYSEGAVVRRNTIVGAKGGSRPGAIVVIKTRKSTITDNSAKDSPPYNFAGADASCTVERNRQE